MENTTTCSVPQGCFPVRGRPSVRRRPPAHRLWCGQGLLWTWPHGNLTPHLHPNLIVAVACWTQPCCTFSPLPTLPQRPPFSSPRPGWSLRKPWTTLPRGTHAVVYCCARVLDATPCCRGALVQSGVAGVSDWVKLPAECLTHCSLFCSPVGWDHG